MDPTQISTGHLSSALPVPTGPSEPEAYRRAPTLMAGETAGSQGRVRVWEPSGRRFGLLLFGYTLLSAAVFWRAPIFGIILFIAALVDIMPAIWQRRYITTDGAGVGITTWRKTRAFRWDEIALYCHGRYGGIPLVFTTSGERIKLNMYGYPSPVMDQFRDVVAARAKLEPVSSGSRWVFPAHRMYLRPGYRVHGFGTFGKIRRSELGAAAAPPALSEPREGV